MTLQLSNGKWLRLKKNATGIVSRPRPTNILPSQWSMDEAQADADTRKTHMRLYLPQRDDWLFGGYRGDVREGVISQLGWFTWDTGLACYVWTSIGQSPRGERVFGRIGAMPVGGTVNDRVWIVPPEEVASFYASARPGPAAWTWTTNASGSIKAIVGPPEWGRRKGHGEFSIDGGTSWTQFAEAAFGEDTEIVIPGLTNNVATPASIKWVNANGDGPVLTQPVTAQAPVVIVAPALTVSVDISGRDVIISASASGTAPLSVDLVALAMDGTDVSGAATGEGPWTYTVASSTADRVVAYDVAATGPGGTTHATGSVTVAADQTVPVDPPAGTITAAPQFTARPDLAVHGRMIIDVTSVPANAGSLWARITVAGGATSDVLITNAAAIGTYNVDMSVRAGNRAAIRTFARNGLGDGPTGAAPELWITAVPSVTAKISPATLYPGDTAILTLATWGYPHPDTTGIMLTLDGTFVPLIGEGNVRTFVVPLDAAGKSLSLTGAVQSPLGVASHAIAKVISPAVAWKAPVVISSRAELDTAVAAATGGEVLTLSTGNYGDFTWPKLLNVPVRITSQGGHRAVFDAVRLAGSARGGMWVDHVDIVRLALGTGGKTCRVQNCLITGRVDIDLSNFVYTDNEHQFGGIDFGVTLSDQTGGYYARNSYFDCGADQFRVAGGVTDCVFERNTHTRISEYAKVAHPDCMQIFGQNGLRVPARIAIRYNRIYDVNGAQGIFMTDSRSIMGYCDCAIHDNMIRAAYTNKLTVSHYSRGTIVTRNSVRGQLGGGKGYGGKIYSNIASLLDADGDNYAYGQFTDPATIFVGDGSTIDSYMPQATLNLPERYGATTFIRLENGENVFAVSPPVITGPRYVGQTLTAKSGDYGAAKSISGQWYAAGVPIAGATALTYSLQPADTGKMVEYRDAGAGLHGSQVTQASNAIGPISAVIPAAPAVTLIGDAAITNTSVTGASKTFDFFPAGGADATKPHIFLGIFDQLSGPTRNLQASPLVWVSGANVAGAALTELARYSNTPGGLRKLGIAGRGIPAADARYGRIAMTGSSSSTSYAGAVLLRVDGPTDIWNGGASAYTATPASHTVTLDLAPGSRIIAFAMGKSGDVAFAGVTQLSARQDTNTPSVRYVTGLGQSVYGGQVTVSADNCNALVVVAVSAG